MEKKSNPIVTYVIGIIFCAVMCILAFVVNKDVILDNYTEFYSMEEKEGVKKDAYVELYVDGVIGNYAETTHTVNFIPTGKDQHYMLWLSNDEIISLTVKDKKLIAKLDEICDDTWDYIESESEEYNVKGTTVKGVINTLDPEIEGYYKQWLNETGIAEAGLDVNYVAIDTTKTRGNSLFMVLFFLAGGVACVVGLVISIKKKKAEEEASQFASNFRATNVEDTFMDQFNNDNNNNF